MARNVCVSTKVAPRLTAPRMTAPISDALLPNPAVWKSTGEKKAMTMTPVSCWSSGTATAITRWGRCCLQRILRYAPSSLARAASTARATPSSSASTSALAPRTRRSAARACSTRPRTRRLLGVSEMSSAPTRMTDAGAAARPRERRHPHRGMRAAP
uniref:Uncharacterized protein n=1 Tax=Oryza rufipogon TaxID=4529 RepID=A0A0E0P9Y9_ORYRU